MRFDKTIEIYKTEIITDEIGGNYEDTKLLDTFNAHVEELSIETTMKIYGEATTDNIKVTLLNKVIYADKEKKKYKIKYNDKLYKIIAKRYVKNKTSFLLEVDKDD